MKAKIIINHANTEPSLGNQEGAETIWQQSRVCSLPEAPTIHTNNMDNDIVHAK